MISLFSGTPGSGKSLHIAQYILDRCKREKTTIGNFEINRDIVPNHEFYQYWDNADITPQNLVKFSFDFFGDVKFREGALLLIIDEAQLLFNAREWNIKGRSDWILFFTQHRKLGFNIIMVSQFDKMIDKQIRSLFEYEYVHRKLSNFGWRGKLLSIWTGNRLFVAVKIWYPLKERVGAEHFLYTPKLGSMYDTRAMFNMWEDFEDVSHYEPDQEGNKSDDVVFEVINY